MFLWQLKVSKRSWATNERGDFQSGLVAALWHYNMLLTGSMNKLQSHTGLTWFSLVCLCFHTKQELGLHASPLLIQCLLSLSWYSASFSFYASVCSLWPPLFSLCHSFIPSSLSSFQSVRRNPKGFVLESCSLVLSGTYSLTPARSLSVCISRPFTPARTQQTDTNTDR